MSKISTVILTIVAVVSIPTFAQARSHCRSRVIHCCPAPAYNTASTLAPSAAVATTTPTEQSIPATTSTTEGNSGTYRSFSYEPSTPAVSSTQNAPVMRTYNQPATVMKQTPRYLMQKADPRKYNY